MRGNIWTVVALGTGIVFLPLILDVDATGETAGIVQDLTTAIAPVIALTFVVAVMGYFLVLFGSDSF